MSRGRSSSVESCNESQIRNRVSLAMVGSAAVAQCPMPRTPPYPHTHIQVLVVDPVVRGSGLQQQGFERMSATHAATAPVAGHTTTCNGPTGIEVLRTCSPSLTNSLYPCIRATKRARLGLRPLAHVRPGTHVRARASSRVCARTGTHVHAQPITPFTTQPPPGSHPAPPTLTHTHTGLQSMHACSPCSLPPRSPDRLHPAGAPARR